MYAAQHLSRERSRAADTARWNGLAAAYGQSVANQRAQTALAAHYTGQALALYAQTARPESLPNCIAAETLAQLPAIGDDSWRATLVLCAD